MAFGSPQWMYKSGEAYEIEQSLKFNNPDNPYLSRTFVTPTNRKIFTFSGWVKRSFNPDYPRIISTATGNDNINFMNDDTLRFQSDFGYLVTTMKFRDPGAWYHIMYAFDSTQSTAANRLKLYVNGTQVTAFGTSDYPTLNDEVDFNSAIVHDIGRNAPEALEYMDGYLAELYWVDGQALTPSSFGETGDYGEWKPIEYSGTYGNNGFYLPFKQDYTVEGFSTITWKGNSTNNRYFGGTGFKPDLIWAKARSIGYSGSIYDSVRGYDRHHLVPSTTEAENGGNHVYGGIASSSADGFTTFVGTDGGNPYANHNEDGKTYVAWNWDMGADTPTGFGCVTYKGSGSVRSVGNVGFSPDLVWIKSLDHTYGHHWTDAVRGAGKDLYSDITDGENSNANSLQVFKPDGFQLGTDNGVNNSTKNYVAWCWDMGGTSVANTTGDINSTVMANTTYGQSIVSWDGTGSGSSPTVGHGLSSAPEFIIVKRRSSDNGAWPVQHKFDTTKYLQFQDVDGATTGATVFDNTAPTSSVFTVNATNAVVNASGHTYIAYCFHSVTGYSKIDSFSGTGSSGNTITTGFRPAFLIVKQTNSAGENWYMFDSTRESFNDLDTALKVDEDSSETTNTAKAVEFTDTGFKLKSTNSALNASGSTYIYIAFAGGMDSISDYNTDGSIDSRVKASTTYGQSVVSYTGNGSNTTVGHGLSSAPEMIIVKNRTNAANWEVYHSAIGNTKHLRLNQDFAEATSSTRWNDTSPTNSLFTLGTNGGVNENAVNYIAYCFHSVTGYSKFGSYSGTAGTHTVTTGFSPAFIMIKRTNSAGEHWYMYDNARFPNSQQNTVTANNGSAESGNSSMLINYLSTGFQIVGTNAGINGNGDTYIYMAFADKREYAYWLDQSGNNNDWTSNNLTESDISVDSPTNNFATLNPLDSNSNITLAEGNLKYIATGGWYNLRGSMFVSSGKWYWEMVKTTSTSIYTQIGAATSEPTLTEDYGDAQNGMWVYSAHNGTKVGQGTSPTSYGASYVTGDVMGIALDMDNGTITFYKNNVSQGQAFSGITGDVAPWISGFNNNNVYNFGQDSSFAGNKTAQGNQDGNDIGDFYYTPPTGFLALCTSNLPDVAVTPSEHFNTVLYTGDGNASRTISGAGFAPDLLWGKIRSTTNNHFWFDTLRGANRLISNSSGAESDYSTWFSTLTSDGFTTGTTNANSINQNNATFVAWFWKANGSGSSNTDGSVTTTVSANPDAGFSIATYTGTGASATFGHGLSKAPEISFYKIRSQGYQWMVYTGNTLSTNGLVLNGTDAGYNAGGTYGTHGASTFALLTNADVNGSGQTYVSYHFHSVDGYSKVGSYTGNGNADGTFVYTGFKPMMVISKYIGTENWNIIDTKRSPHNLMEDLLKPDSNAAEIDTQIDIDFLSNGFKPRIASGFLNGNGHTIIYIAFAETPFKYSNAR